MKNLVIASDYCYPPLGGTERHVMDTAKYFSNKYAVSVVSPNWGRNTYEKIVVNGITIHKFPAKGGSKLARMFGYHGAVSEIVPDIVISHYYLPSISMLMLNFVGVNVYPVIHELKNIRAGSAFLLNSFSNIFVRTHELKEKCVKLGINKNKLIVTHHEVNPMFNVKNLKKKYDVIYVSRITTDKGVGKFLEIVRENMHLKFCLIGAYGSDSDKEIYEPELQESKYYNLDYLGFVPDEELVTAYNQSRVFLSCSKEEGFGITAIEAMACGLPAVVSGAGGLKEAVGDYGIITNNYSEEINNLLTDKQRYSRYSKLSLERASQLEFGSVMRIYEDVIGGKNGQNLIETHKNYNNISI